MSHGTETIQTADGVTRVLNLQPSDPARVARYAAAPKVEIPLSEIRDFQSWPSELKLKDQGPYGACTGHAAALAVEYVRLLNSYPHVPLSAWWVYGRLANGVDAGSNILQSLELLQSEGVAPESEVRWGDFSGRYPVKAYAAATRFKVRLGRPLTTWEQILSAVALGEPVVYSVRATNDWMGTGNLNAEGVPPVGRGQSNHAVAAMGGIKTLKNGERAAYTPNSWTKVWGWNGCCWVYRAHWESATWREAYTLEQVDSDPLDSFPIVSA